MNRTSTVEDFKSGGCSDNTLDTFFLALCAQMDPLFGPKLTNKKPFGGDTIAMLSGQATPCAIESVML